MKSLLTANNASRVMSLVMPALMAFLLLCSQVTMGHGVRDLKYGAVLYEFHQQKYFETLVEYAYAHERGGIQQHGNYPELLKGGVSLSYGLDVQAQDIFSDLIAENSDEMVQNRAWYYLARMLYLRGDIERAATTLSSIQGPVPHEIGQEYLYLAALINIKLGHFDEAEQISRKFNRKSPYAPFLYFNLGVALGKQKDYGRAIKALEKSANYSDGSRELDRLADRSHMAIAYLYTESQDARNANASINQVSTTGVFSNRALLGAGWSFINSGAYHEALAPLGVLERRSMAIPEVQEAVLLVPHVYEKMNLPGRAAEGFISAYDRYEATLDQLGTAREALRDADVLELFVSNLDDVLGESDWFGTAPSVSINPLSPFLLDLMSDHSFQSVLKDLRDLYAIRNNLNSWKNKQDDFDVILGARLASLDAGGRMQMIETGSGRLAELQQDYAGLIQQAELLKADERERVQWLIDDIDSELGNAAMLTEQLRTPAGFALNKEHYAAQVERNMRELDGALDETNELIGKVENVMLELVNAELGIHEERLKYYRVQSHLAKVRILDRSLADLDASAQDGHKDDPDTATGPVSLEKEDPVREGDGDAA